MFIRLTMIFLFTLTLIPAQAQKITSPRFETYVTAHQIDRHFSTSQDHEEALATFKNANISKVYLETLRSGYTPKIETVKAARDFFMKNGIEVSGAIATTNGEDFGIPANSEGIWLNYEADLTQRALSKHITKYAPLFKEIMIDDFFATDDTSEISRDAKGKKSWSEYRMDLMMRTARQTILQTARELDPDIEFILKFPQWYDRFHRFGYDVVTAPEIFDRIWVGTETRKPDTQRFGYVMPTQGYINFTWLKSIGGKKVAGGWFDFGDCSAPLYLMQAYQTALAGAEELVLFEAGSILNAHECFAQMLKRQPAVMSLSQTILHKKPKGLYCYKPPHSEGSDPLGAANLYIYDYLAMMGLSPRMTAQAPDIPEAIFLPRQAAEDPEIEEHLKRWLENETTLIVTPDFLIHVNDSELGLLKLRPDSLNRPPRAADKITFRSHRQETSLSLNEPYPEFRFAPNIDSNARRLCYTKDAFILSSHRHEKGSMIYILNLQTFSHEEFSPTREQFLPPRPVLIQDWNAETQWSALLGNILRDELNLLGDISIHSKTNIGLNLFSGRIIVLSNFSPHASTCRIKSATPIKLHPDFLHADGVERNEKSDHTALTIPPWELAVLVRK